MRLIVLPVGKLKDPALDRLCATYLERTQPFLATEVRECRDTTQQWETVTKLSALAVVLDERGTLHSTTSLCDWLRGEETRGRKSLAFLIGDAHGFGPTDRERADLVWSLSPLTLPHRLARVVLLEQLYRCATLLRGHPYHHG